MARPATEGYVGGRSEAKPKKVLDHLKVRKGEKGGHIIEHHFTSMVHEPQHFIFGQQEGPEAHEHIAKHMNMPMENPASEPQSPDEKEVEETGKGD